jgi:short-subunit dehydrogenase
MAVKKRPIAQIPIAELVSLLGRRALITGAAAGIGRAMAHRFAEASADLELVDINTHGLNAVKSELEQFHHEVNTHKAVDGGFLSA